MTDDTKVARTLQKNFLAAVAASNIESLPVQVLGRNFTIPTDQKYIEFSWFPNDPADGYWNDEKIYEGFFRIALHWPIDDGGIYSRIDDVMSVAAYFTKGRQLKEGDFSARVSQNPRFLGPIEGDKDMVFPVSVWYRSFRFS